MISQTLFVRRRAKQLAMHSPVECCLPIRDWQNAWRHIEQKERSCSLKASGILPSGTSGNLSR